MSTHIVSTFEVYDPSTLDTIALLGTLLRQNPSDFELWSNSAAAREYSALSISIIRPYSNAFPQNGDLIVLSANMRVGHWYRYQNFGSISLVHIDHTQEMFCQTMHQLTMAGKHKVEIVYANNRIKRLIGLEGLALSA